MHNFPRYPQNQNSGGYYTAGKEETEAHRRTTDLFIYLFIYFEWLHFKITFTAKR